MEKQGKHVKHPLPGWVNAIIPYAIILQADLTTICDSRITPVLQGSVTHQVHQAVEEQTKC